MIKYVGIEGMAYFSSAYNVYMLINSISAAGLPVALSILVSKNATDHNRANIKRIFRVFLTVFASLGTLGMLSLFFGADAYSDAISIPETALAVKAIAPTLLFICISSAIRGYFQGHEIMSPTAVSQLIESLGKLVLGVGFALVAVDMGATAAESAAAAIFGLSVGVFISLLYLLITYIILPQTKRFRKFKSGGGMLSSYGEILKALLIISLPITLSSCITSITTLTDTALITNRLTSSGMTQQAAVVLYSSYTNLAIPMFNLVPALIAPIGIALVPALTSAITSNCMHLQKQLFDTSMRLCLAISIPASAGLAVFAKPILSALYKSEMESVELASPLLSVLAIPVVFSAITTITNATLQAYSKQALPIISMGVGALVKIISEYFLVSSAVGIYGAPLSTILCTLVVVLINLFFVMKYTPSEIDLRSIIKILIATVISVSLAILCYLAVMQVGLNSLVALIASILVAVFSYLILAILLRIVKDVDFGMIYKGEQLLSFLKKHGLFKQ